MPLFKIYQPGGECRPGGWCLWCARLTAKEGVAKVGHQKSWYPTLSAKSTERMGHGWVRGAGRSGARVGPGRGRRGAGRSQGYG